MTDLFELVSASCGVLFLIAMTVGSVSTALIALLAIFKTVTPKQLNR